MNEPQRRTSTGPPQDEAPLIRAAQGGDPRAFGEIMRRYQRAVYRIAYGYMRSPTDADDLAQETFVRAYKALDRFRVGEPLYPWLARIARNQALSLLRSRRRRPEAALEPLVEAGRQWGVDADPADDVERRERNARLEAAFAHLSPEHQEVMLLRVVEDLSYDEIAAALGIPAGTVMSRLSRARSELRARMEGSAG